MSLHTVKTTFRLAFYKNLTLSKNTTGFEHMLLRPTRGKIVFGMIHSRIPDYKDLAFPLALHMSPYHAAAVTKFG